MQSRICKLTYKETLMLHLQKSTIQENVAQALDNTIMTIFNLEDPPKVNYLLPQIVVILQQSMHAVPATQEIICHDMLWFEVRRARG